MTTVTEPAPSNTAVETSMAPSEIQAVDPALGQTALGVVLLTGQVALKGGSPVTDDAAQTLIGRLEAAGHEAHAERIRILEAPHVRVVVPDIYDDRTGDHGVGGGIGRVQQGPAGTQPVPVPPIPSAGVETGTPFTVFLAPEGVESSDGRLLEPGTTTFHDGPMPLMVQDTGSHGAGQVPAPSWYAGSIEEAFRDPANERRLMGRGHLMANEDGARAEDLIRGGLRTVSIDAFADMPPTAQPQIVDQDGTVVKALVRYADTHIRGATVVPIPAFENACIWLAGEQTPACVYAMDGAEPVSADAEPVVTDSTAVETLLASGGGPLHPPTHWFYRPEPDEYTPLTVTDEGEIYGHVARWRTCHLGHVGTCETAPRSGTNYHYFHTDAAKTAQGDTVPCGVLTLNTTHQRNMNADAQATMDHYDHTGTAVAKLRLRDGKHGIWASGAVRPGLADEHIWALQGAKASGDWRDIRDQGQRYKRELVALLCVNSPGFPVPRPEVLVASGQIVAQVGELRCETCEEEREMAKMGHPSNPIPAALTDVTMLLERIQQLEAEVRALKAPTLLASARERISMPMAKYDTATRKKMAKAGTAMPDGSFPIGDAEDVTNAVRAVGRAGADHDAVRRHIIKRAKALGKTSAIPDNWGPDGSTK